MPLGQQIIRFVTQVPLLTVCCAFSSMIFGAGAGLIHFGHEKVRLWLTTFFLVYDQRMILFNCWHWANSAKASLSSYCQSVTGIFFSLIAMNSLLKRQNETHIIGICKQEPGNLKTVQADGHTDINEKRRTKLNFTSVVSFLFIVLLFAYCIYCLHMYDHSIVQIELKYLLDHLLNCWYFVRVYRLRMGMWKREGGGDISRNSQRETERERERERERTLGTEKRVKTEFEATVAIRRVWTGTEAKSVAGRPERQSKQQRSHLTSQSGDRGRDRPGLVEREWRITRRTSFQTTRQPWSRTDSKAMTKETSAEKCRPSLSLFGAPFCLSAASATQHIVVALRVFTSVLGNRWLLLQGHATMCRQSIA